MNCGAASVMRLMRQCVPFLSLLHSFCPSVHIPFPSSLFPSVCLSSFCLFPLFFLSFFHSCISSFLVPNFPPFFLSLPFSRIIFLCIHYHSLSFLLILSFPYCSFPSLLSIPESLLVVCGAALPLPGVVHARCANGAGDEVGGARGHEVSHCRRDVHPLVCH